MNSAKLKGNIPPGHKLTTMVIAHKRSLATPQPFQHNLSNRFWARKPCLPKYVVEAKSLINFKDNKPL